VKKTINLRYFAAVREAAGVEGETRKATSVAEALEEASSDHGSEFARLVTISSLLHNGVALPKDDVAQPLSEDAQVDVLPPFAGG